MGYGVPATSALHLRVNGADLHLLAVIVVAVEEALVKVGAFSFDGDRLLYGFNGDS